MKTLVKKDIYLMGFINVLIIMAGSLFGYMNILSIETDVVQAGSLVSGLILIYIPLSNMITEERKTKDFILKSLPIDRRDIVLSRYITMFIYIIFVFGVTFISSYIIRFSYDIPIVGKAIPLSGLLYNIIIVMIFISLALPVQYLRRKTSSILNVIIYLSMVLVPAIISRINSNISFVKIFKDIGNLRFKINPIIYISMGIGLYFISFLISTKLYKSIDR